MGASHMKRKHGAIGGLTSLVSGIMRRTNRPRVRPAKRRRTGRKSKSRNSRTAVKQQRRKRSSKSLVGQVGGLQNSFSWSGKWRQWMNATIKNNNPAIYQVDNQISVKGLTGRQGFATIVYCYTPSDIANQYAWLNTSAQGATVGGANSANFDNRNVNKIFLHSMVARTAITNLCNVTTKITLYLVRPRRDLAGGLGDPATSWSRIGPEEFTDPTAQAGNFAGQINANGAYYPGSTPFLSKEFVDNFKVMGVKKMVLDPGQTDDLTTTVKPYANIDSSVNGTYNYLRYPTTFVLASVCPSSVGVDTADGSLTYPACFIGTITNYSYKSYQPAVQPQRLIQRNTLRINTADKVDVVSEFGAQLGQQVTFDA